MPRRFQVPVLLIMISSAGRPANAQIVNVLPRVSKHQSEGLTGSISGAFNWKTGNTNILQAAAKLSAAYKRQQHLIFFTASSRYGTQNDDVYVNRTFEHLRYRRAVLDTLELEGFGQHEFDEFKRLRLRTVVGGGPRVVIELGEQLGLAVGSTYMLEYELLSANDDYPDPLPRVQHRWSNYAQIGYQIDKDLRVSNTTYVQPRFDNFRDVRLLSQSSVAVDANDWFAVVVSFTVAHDSKPPRGVKNLDKSLETVLKLSL